ncbi:hypothetical protein RRG08_002727 [Elysia crispata]|uniref:Uncharacterized protein n=1 Tax=Elysia crispata TaxID=231223 RepID=A0AAE0XTU0_9GAST|nr:hypothetical protein RRG08_002727 [Elysia crispata]
MHLTITTDLSKHAPTTWDQGEHATNTRDQGIMMNIHLTRGIRVNMHLTITRDHDEHTSNTRDQGEYAPNTRNQGVSSASKMARLCCGTLTPNCRRAKQQLRLQPGPSRYARLTSSDLEARAARRCQNNPRHNGRGNHNYGAVLD